MEKVQEEGIEFLLISSANLDSEREKLNADEATKQTIIHAVNSSSSFTVYLKYLAGVVGFL